MFKLVALRAVLSNLKDALKDPVQIFGSLKRDFFAWLFSLRIKLFDTKDKFKDLFSTNVELGLYHFYRLDFSEALFRFNLVAIVKSDSVLVPYNKARCLFYQGKLGDARSAINRALAIMPDHAPSIFYQQKIARERHFHYIPVEVTKEYFDYAALRYVNTHIIEGRYSGHSFLFKVVCDYFGEKAINVRYLDLGCGTGVCGQFLRMRNVGKSITGVDVSSAMLNIAHSCVISGVPAYNKIVNDDIMSFDCDENWDVISLLDVCDYMGNLDSVLLRVKSWLADEGILVGAVRKIADAVVKNDYALSDEQGCNFFSFSGSYLKSIFQELGLEILLLEDHALYDGIPCWFWVVRC